MAWTSPMTFSSGAVLTAAQLNTHLRDNLNETSPAKATTAGRIFVSTGANAIAERAIAGSGVVTAQTTTSTSFTDLATAGPAVAVTTGTTALVIISAGVANDSAGGRTLASYAVSGATTDAADDTRSIIYDESSAGRIIAASRVEYKTGLTAGSNTFTMKYRVGGGTGTFQFRHIAVIGL